MTSLNITGFYAGLLALLLIVLAVNIIRLRYQFKVGIGDGGQTPLAKAIRIHGNFIEYIPLALVLLACYEVSGANVMFLHALGSILFIGRVLHAIGLTKSTGVSKQRQIGMTSTFIVILILSIENIRLFVF